MIGCFWPCCAQVLISVEACGRCLKAFRGEREGKTFVVRAGGGRRGLKRPRPVKHHPARGKDPVRRSVQGLRYLLVFANGGNVEREGTQTEHG